ncbi:MULTISPECIES: hypothetical protein [Sutcliffiella]|uniref:Uncharacterized protein n=1 Tax=Sutcliffiella cohnii TaxID=33932 RepID=A0A223KV17_9BACI|nr:MULTISPECIES: hypothetical protein [Sutcliffiella]AST93178.1 hypothetical protein BC6307_18885 [Sutcliffiella cohnii]WBL14381.1 hypothetical protein O1A01_21275 [Sutcliffiella sp. NC1]
MQQQQNMGGQQQPIYPQPPNIVTTKDSLYLADMMSWNLLAMKKAHHFAQQCQDQEVKQLIEKAGQMHQRHYEKILSQTQSTQQQQPLQ